MLTEKFTKLVPGIKLLHEKIASGAFHNAVERFDGPKCHLFAKPSSRRSWSGLETSIN
jgi:hypothetical protein